MKRYLYITIISLLTFLVISTLDPNTNYARPGGGHSYSNDPNFSWVLAVITQDEVYKRVNLKMCTSTGSVTNSK